MFKYRHQLAYSKAQENLLQPKSSTNTSCSEDKWNTDSTLKSCKKSKEGVSNLPSI